MTKAELIAEKSAMKTELQNLRQGIKGVFSHDSMQNIELEIQKITTRINLIDMELSIMNQEEAFAKEQAFEE